MNCSLSRNHMMKCFDGEHNDIEDAYFKQHLKACQHCREEFEEMKKVFDILETITQVQPPENFETEVMEKIGVLENKRKKNTAKALVFLYNTAILVSIVMLVVFLVRALSANVPVDTGQEGSELNFLSVILVYLYGLFKGVYSFATGMANLLYQAGSIIIKMYYFYIVAVSSMVIIIQRAFTIIVKQNRRSA
jgi:hypothetical protein